MTTIPQLLEEQFRALKIFKDAARARHLKTDQATYSRILNGKLKLTPKRARAWSAILFPIDTDKASAFERRLLGEDRPRTVREFFERLVADGGAVPAERMADLLEVLATVARAVVCIEYRDLPRAGPASKYEGMGPSLGLAIARGVSVAMFQPFGLANPLSFLAEGGSSQSLAIATYLSQLQQKCRGAYLTFQQDALNACRDGARVDREKGDKDLSDEELVDRRLRLYERRIGEPFEGSGFQAKLFYVQYLTGEEGNESATIRHQRLFQWLSTPRQDLLVYRGETDLSPDAIRDGFYPIGHYFDCLGYLPVDGDETADEVIRKKMPPVPGSPQKFDLWKAYVRPA